MLFIGACGDDSTLADSGVDGATDAGGDGGSDAASDASTDAALDATPDASSDASSDAASDGSADATVDGGACATCIGADLTWGPTGGFVASRRTSVLAPCRTYTLTELVFGSPDETRVCTNDVPCGTTAAVEIADVLAALAHADVVAAFAAAPVTYGRDLRPVDGTIFQVSQSGATFLVGSPCTGTGTCLPIPSGVQALVDLLQALDAERLTERDCTTVFP
ncbi:MAG: hypothetical protein DRJ42_14015 [Deltaproteobacteria bacterium]|nr:MAG: hypothetical protein DRJ42_14015 [Deltaproteobacteria bacterium]